MRISFEDFPNICRLCLKHGNLQPIRQINTFNLFSKMTDIEIKKKEILPDNICKECFQQLENIQQFTEKCKLHNDLLSKLYDKYKRKVPNFEECDTSATFETQCISYDEVIPKSFDYVQSIKHQRKTKQIKKEYVSCPEDLQQEKLDIHISCTNDCLHPVYKTKFNTVTKLTKRFRTHRKDMVYKCPECYQMFTYAENLRKHASVHKSVKPFVCRVCEKGFLRKRSLDEHMNFHTGNTPYICVYCGKDFKRLTNHAAHIYHMHNDNIGKVPKLKRKYTEKRINLNIECKICSKMFASRSGYANHQLIHKGIKKFLCNICGKCFITNPTLQSHIRTHTGEKPFECKDCGKCFRQRNSLNVHKSQHLTDALLICLHCNKKYHSKKGLDVHMLTHIDDNLSDCPNCKKKIQKEDLQNHISKHNEEKPHRCHLCTKSFISPSHLKIHLRSHSGEKPYFCSVCGKGLSQPQTLKVHMRQHTGETPYKCSICDKAFYDSSNYKRHISKHHIERNDE